MSIDYPARFEGLTSDTLFALEYPNGMDAGSDCDAPQEHVEQLLVVLADWRQRILDGSRSDVDNFRAALDAVREAWLQYSFRWEGGPSLPYPFDLPMRVSL
ncbi:MULTISPECIES: hypothetical protein [unclassified Streptomyces]|uniref:hypothetical protein n=1 Tax=unclassified Streptomyces TaxID=2593676 RepID=UPI000BEF3802|nr:MULTISPECIES: hypothetical protein [unclassified Streptomyces]